MLKILQIFQSLTFLCFETGNNLFGIELITIDSLPWQDVKTRPNAMEKVFRQIFLLSQRL